MLKNSKPIHQLHSVVQEFEGFFHCDTNVPTTVVKEMLFDFLKLIGQIEDNMAAQQKAAADEAAQSLPQSDLPIQDHCVKNKEPEVNA